MSIVWDSEALKQKGDDESWDEYRSAAGISLACTYDTESAQYEFFDQHTLEALAKRLENTNEVISYNGVGYDHCVLDAALARRVYIQREIDLWVVIKTALTHNWGKGAWTLGAVCERTIGHTKTSDGAFAPSLFRDGKLGQLTTYLVRDVWLTTQLWEFITRYGYVIQPDSTKLGLGKRIEVLCDA